MEFELKTKGMEDIMRSIDKLSKGIDPEELNRWAKTVETFAKKFCNDRLHNITLRSLDRELDLAVKDRKSADCLVRAIETNLPLMPLYIQGVFTKLASELRQAKFNA